MYYLAVLRFSTVILTTTIFYQVKIANKLIWAVCAFRRVSFRYFRKHWLYSFLSVCQSFLCNIFLTFYISIRTHWYHSSAPWHAVCSRKWLHRVFQYHSFFCCFNFVFSSFPVTPSQFMAFQGKRHSRETRLYQLPVYYAVTPEQNERWNVHLEHLNTVDVSY